MKMLASFLPFYITTLCVISGVSALPSTQDQEMVKVLKNIASTLGHPCPSGWTRFNDYCYLVSSSIKSWSEAQKYCLSKEGNLVKINSAEENEFVLNLVQKKAPLLQQVWIGLKRVSNKHYWYDYSVPVYTNWGPGEPNGRDREPCGHMWVAAHRYGVPVRATAYWNDIPCQVIKHLPNGIVCKKLP